MHQVKDSAEMAFVALGSNLGNSTRIVRRAMERLQPLSAAPLLRSSLLRTRPVNCPPGSPPFLNAVIGLRPLPGEVPQSLLRQLRQLEREFGRQPGKIRNAPRRLDLDLIAFGSQIIDSPQLVLPHPRAHMRRFVLQPLNQIAPEFVLPGQKKCVRDLLLSLPLTE
jgi:2-amino-4-hydroxy-6-hydroxymethyldihydropteridine diphosphokinase